MEIKKTEIKTTDIYYASALMACGGTLTKTDKSDARHMRFHVNIISASIPESVNGDLESQWVNCTLMVNAALYRDAIQRLKAVIHSE